MDAQGARAGTMTAQQARQDYIDLCKTAKFVATKGANVQAGYESLQQVSACKLSLECDRGAHLGGGKTRRLLTGFAEGEPLGAASIVLKDDLDLDDSELESWRAAFWEYGCHTAHGHLVLTVTIRNFSHWAMSKACRDEVRGVKPGRLFVYLEHPPLDTFTHPGRGFIVALDAQSNRASTTVDDGYGYLFYYEGSWYEGEIQVRPGVRGSRLASASGPALAPRVARAAGPQPPISPPAGSHPLPTHLAHACACMRTSSQDGVKHGQGTLTWADGAVYAGKWEVRPRAPGARRRRARARTTEPLRPAGCPRERVLTLRTSPSALLLHPPSSSRPGVLPASLLGAGACTTGWQEAW